MSSHSRVQRHFDKDAQRFDAIYEPGKPIHQRIVDRLFRQVVIERFRLVCNLAPGRAPWTVLDVGCGSGRYGLELAREGAARAVGLDFSTRMIDLARQEAMRAGLAGRCEFQACEFLEYDAQESFDVVLAMGYFDYLRDPLAHLRKMTGLCRGRLFASFPKRWEWRAPSRKLRFMLQRGFVRFYTRGDVVRLIAAAGIPAERASIVSYDRDFLLIVRPPGAAGSGAESGS
jgi:2-polyprenyl-3-methyl-5-hydroxy-6-metoxy-1,4-benzoquinol methylase